MAAGGDSRREDDAPGADVDLYAVLGLKKECTDAELRLAYRRLAMIWHPDRCSASGSSTCVEEAKERFQEIQGAYSVLSDSNKRFLYDVGVYDSDDELSGMGDFLGEIAQMMDQATPAESFEELQQLFVDMFQADLDAGLCSGPATGHRAQVQIPVGTSQSPSRSSTPPCPPPPGRTNAQAPPSCKGVNKRRSSAMGSGKPLKPGRPGLGLGRACPGSVSREASGGKGRRHGRRTGASAAAGEAAGSRSFRRATTCRRTTRSRTRGSVQCRACGHE